MTMRRKAKNKRPARWVPHLVAVPLSMGYAWSVAQTSYVTTGLQFVSPLLLIMATHLVWLQAGGATVQGYARIAFRRSLVSAVASAMVVPLVEIASPKPSYAGSEMAGAGAAILTVLFCLAVLATVLALAAVALYLVYLALDYLVRLIFRRKGGGLNDLASLALGATLILTASLEGMPQGYSFATGGRATASVLIDASPETVWEAMQTATIPEVPLPAALQMFPQPIAVPVDEGTELGARRVVVIEGREGRGLLHLRVVEQTDTRAVFEVVSDTSPISRWIALQSLSYDIAPMPGGNVLNVSLTYDRLLSPSWAFAPMMRVAARLAMGVLAGDTKARAEATS
ncbi:MAG: hypothetical protein AAFO51_06255 [Pseudomonadota bacterium]